MTLFLRTESKAELDAALELAGIVDLRTGWEHPGLVRIGPIPPRCDESGAVLAAGDARYHANLRLEGDPAPEVLAVLPAIEPPANPYTVIA